MDKGFTKKCITKKSLVVDFGNDNVNPFHDVEYMDMVRKENPALANIPDIENKINLYHHPVTYTGDLEWMKGLRSSDKFMALIPFKVSFPTLLMAMKCSEYKTVTEDMFTVEERVEIDYNGPPLFSCDTDYSRGGGGVEDEVEDEDEDEVEDEDEAEVEDEDNTKEEPLLKKHRTRRTPLKNRRRKGHLYLAFYDPTDKKKVKDQKNLTRIERECRETWGNKKTYRTTLLNLSLYVEDVTFMNLNSYIAVSFLQYLYYPQLSNYEKVDTLPEKLAERLRPYITPKKIFTIIKGSYPKNPKNVIHERNVELLTHLFTTNKELGFLLQTTYNQPLIDNEENSDMLLEKIRNKMPDKLTLDANPDRAMMELIPGHDYRDVVRKDPYTISVGWRKNLSFYNVITPTIDIENLEDHFKPVYYESYRGKTYTFQSKQALFQQFGGENKFKALFKSSAVYKAYMLKFVLKKYLIHDGVDGYTCVQDYWNMSTESNQDKLNKIRDRLEHHDPKWQIQLLRTNSAYLYETIEKFQTHRNVVLENIREELLKDPSKLHPSFIPSKQRTLVAPLKHIPFVRKTDVLKLMNPETAPVGKAVTKKVDKLHASLGLTKTQLKTFETLRIDALNRNPQSLQEISEYILKEPDFEKDFKKEEQRLRIQENNPTLKGERVSHSLLLAVKKKYGSLEPTFVKIKEFIEKNDLGKRFPNIQKDIDTLTDRWLLDDLIVRLPQINERTVPRHGVKGGTTTIAKDRISKWSNVEHYVQDGEGLKFYLRTKYEDLSQFATLIRQHRFDATFLRDNKNIRADVEWMEHNVLSAKKSTRKVCPRQEPPNYFISLMKPKQKTLKSNRG